MKLDGEDMSFHCKGEFRGGIPSNSDLNTEGVFVSPNPFGKIRNPVVIGFPENKTWPVSGSMLSGCRNRGMLATVEQRLCFRYPGLTLKWSRPPPRCLFKVSTLEFPPNRNKKTAQSMTGPCRSSCFRALSPVHHRL